jgi:photosystem II stability/assembly factor-like uncharacterized protein
MKKIAIIFCFLTSVFSQVNAQTGIHIQEYTGNAYVYNKDSVYMPISFSTGYSHMALVNPDNKQWKYLNPVNYNKYLGPFVMKNAQEGVMIYSSSQKVYKTTDGWQTVTEIANVANGWGLSQIEVSNDGYVGYEAALKNVHFSADGITWVESLDASSGTNILRAKGSKVILFTGAVSGNYVSTDGGQTFVMIPFGGTFLGNFIDFELLSEDTVMVLTSSHLYKSFDGGQSWTERAFPATTQSMIVKDTAEIFITTTSQNYYTADGGATWQMKDNTATGPGDFVGNDLFIWPNYKSTDNGATWTSFLPQNISNTTIFDLHFKGNLGLIGKAGGKVSCTFDKGCSFGFDVTLPTSEDIMAVKILNNGDYIAGDRKSQIFYSTDNGQTWTQRFSNTFNYNAVKFSSSVNDSIIVETRLGQPVVSSDFGASFNFITAGGGSHSQTVKPNGEIIDAGGWFDYTTFQYKGLEISRLTPSGNKTILDSFLVSTNAATEGIADIAMASNTVGYLVTTNTTTNATNIYKTTNGWMTGTTFLGTVSSFGATRIHVLSADTLMLTAASSSVYYYSYNGGTTWNQASLDVFTNYPNLYTSIKKGFFFDANNYIFALNDYGLYMNTQSSGGVPTSVSELSNSITSFRNEINVYPNPTKDNISIDYKGFADIQICDYTGRIIYKKLKSNTSESISVSDFTAGLYIITLQTNSERLTSRFLKH